MENRHCSCYSGISLLLAARRRKRSERAFTLIEILFALMIFVLMSLMVAAVIPATSRTQQFSNSYAQAMSVSQSKIDRLQQMVSSQGLATTCTVAALEAVDPSTGKVTLDDATLNGDGSITGTFTNVDSLKQYLTGAKSGSDANDPTGLTGMLTLTPYNKIGASDTLWSVQVTIKWREAGKPQSSYSIESVLTKNLSS